MNTDAPPPKKQVVLKILKGIREYFLLLCKRGFRVTLDFFITFFNLISVIFKTVLSKRSFKVYREHQSDFFLIRIYNQFLVILGEILNSIEEGFQDSRWFKPFIFGIFFSLTWIVGLFWIYFVKDDEKPVPSSLQQVSQDTQEENDQPSKNVISRSALDDYYFIENEIDLRHNTKLIVTPTRNNSFSIIKEEMLDHLNELELTLEVDRVIRREILNLNQ